MCSDHSTLANMCSLNEMVRESVLTKLIIGDRTYKSRVEDALRASEGVVCVAAPFALQENVTIGTAAELNIPTPWDVLVISTEILGKRRDGVDMLELVALSIRSVQRRKSPRAKVTLSVLSCVRGTTERERAETVNLSNSGLRIRQCEGTKIDSGLMLDMTISLPQNSYITFTAMVVDEHCDEEHTQKRALLNLKITNIDSENQLRLYRLCNSLLCG